MNDDVLFYTVFKFFEQRGEIRDDCAEFVKLYQAKFLMAESVPATVTVTTTTTTTTTTSVLPNTNNPNLASAAEL
jgi:hypothetical protein